MHNKTITGIDQFASHQYFAETRKENITNLQVFIYYAITCPVTVPVWQFLIICGTYNIDLLSEFIITAMIDRILHEERLRFPVYLQILTF